MKTKTHSTDQGLRIMAETLEKLEQADLRKLLEACQTANLAEGGADLDPDLIPQKARVDLQGEKRWSLPPLGEEQPALSSGVEQEVFEHLVASSTAQDEALEPEPAPEASRELILR
jgi:hypothetical protein